MMINRPDFLESMRITTLDLENDLRGFVHQIDLLERYVRVNIETLPHADLEEYIKFIKAITSHVERLAITVINIDGENDNA